MISKAHKGKPLEFNKLPLKIHHLFICNEKAALLFFFFLVTRHCTFRKRRENRSTKPHGTKTPSPFWNVPWPIRPPADTLPGTGLVRAAFNSPCSPLKTKLKKLSNERRSEVGGVVSRAENVTPSLCGPALFGSRGHPSKELHQSAAKMPPFLC